MVFSMRGWMMEVWRSAFRTTGGVVGGGWGGGGKPVTTTLTYCNIREKTPRLLQVESVGTHGR